MGTLTAPVQATAGTFTKKPKSSARPQSRVQEEEEAQRALQPVRPWSPGPGSSRTRTQVIRARDLVAQDGSLSGDRMRQIPVHAAPGRPLGSRRLTLGGSSGSSAGTAARTIAPPGSQDDGVMTIPDAGAPVPATGGAAGSGSGSGSGGGTAPAHFRATPSNARIHNIRQTRDLPLYGHEFDFSVDIAYAAAPAGATADDDCVLHWNEKVTDPPSWQTAIHAGQFNDMYALYPTSPTFDGWRARTKPVPGSETATIHDTPATRTDLPSRTLWFNIVVNGTGTTSTSATGTQTLVPDGHGGITTQTMTTP